MIDKHSLYATDCMMYVAGLRLLSIGTVGQATNTKHYCCLLFVRCTVESRVVPVPSTLFCFQVPLSLLLVVVMHFDR